MPRRDDVFQSFESAIAAKTSDSPWVRIDGTPRFVPDTDLLAELIGIPVQEHRSQTSGRFAKAIDAWCAYELRRAGFDADEVWPRASAPRVLTPELVTLLAELPHPLRGQVAEKARETPAVTPVEAKILGRVYSKQVDVLVAQWARGAELLVSTKSMLSSFGNNLKNRFEESYGDAKNLRGRFPLASMGFLYLVRSTVPPGDLEFAIDMIRKLRVEEDVYDATALLIAAWDEPFSGVNMLNDQAPEDVGPAQFLETIIGRVLDRTPVDLHLRVRELREGRTIPVEEAGTGLAEDPASDAG